MKIEAGKYYKNSLRDVVGPISYVDHPTFMFHAGGKSYTAGGMFYNDGDISPFDLVEEVNADGSPIAPEPPVSLSWNVPADRSWRDEIALRVLPTLVADFLKDVRAGFMQADVGESGPQWSVVAKEALAIADEFIKAAKQS